MLAGAVQSPALGLSRSEIARYSIGRALSNAMDPGSIGVPGFEGEIHAELEKRFRPRTVPHSVLIPLDVLRHYAGPTCQTRADTVASPTGGGYLVETENRGFVGLALPRSVAGLLPIQILEGLVGNINIPVMLSAGTQTDLATETTPAVESDLVFGQVSLTPRTVGAYTELSRVLLKQTSPSAQAFLTNQLLAAFAARIEFLMLQGTGVNGEPRSIIAEATGSANGAAIALADLLHLQTVLGNRLDGSGAYLASQSTAALLAARQKAPGTSSFLWEGGIFSGRAVGVPAYSTQNMPAATLLFAAWQYVMLASWGTLQIETNPFANFQAGLVGIRILHDFDVALLDPAAVAVASPVT